MKTFLSTLALALALSFTAAPAAAKLSEGRKCAMKANLLTGKLSLCLNKADANVSKGKATDTAAADAKCEKKFRDGWDKTRDKAEEKDASLGADCDGAMSDAVRDSVEASSLIAAGRDLTLFAVSDADLADDSGVQTLIDDAVAAVDITSNDPGVAAAAAQAACVEANGTWDGSVCTPAAVPDRDCFRAGACGVDGWNDGAFVGVTSSSTGCSDTSAGTDSYTLGTSIGYVLLWNGVTDACEAN